MTATLLGVFCFVVIPLWILFHLQDERTEVDRNDRTSDPARSDSPQTD